MAATSEGSQAPGTFSSPQAAPPLDPLRKLVEENAGWLRGWVRGRVSDPELAHEVCQDALLKALRAGSTLKDPARFGSWLFRIAENTLRDHLRRQARRRRWLLFSDQLDAQESPAVEAQAARGPEEVGSEELEKLLEAVRRLPPRYREPLLLKHAQDLPYARIAEILGISENAVQVRIFRARKMLRERTRKWLEP